MDPLDRRRAGRAGREEGRGVAPGTTRGGRRGGAWRRAGHYTGAEQGRTPAPPESAEWQA